MDICVAAQQAQQIYFTNTINRELEAFLGIKLIDILYKNSLNSSAFLKPEKNSGSERELTSCKKIIKKNKKITRSTKTEVTIENTTKDKGENCKKNLFDFQHNYSKKITA